jgi:galactokinase
VTRDGSFSAVFGDGPAIAASAHGRVNLMGDHTDYNQGFVLPTLIPQETCIEVAPAKDGVHEVYSATLDRLIRFDEGGTLSDFARYIGGCVRVVAEAGHRVPPLRWRIASDVPVGSGLSSSAALEVAAIRAIDGLLGLQLDAQRIAFLAHEAETRHAGVACGIMDQMVCSIGALDRMLFLDTASLDRRLVPLPAGGEILVVDSGLPRSLASSHYNERRAECEEAAARLRVSSLREISDPAAVEELPSPLKQRARHVVTENARVLAAIEADAAQFGSLMNESHASLRDDYAVSLPGLDMLVAALQSEPGCFGARLTGAGFGGCCVALVAEGTARRMGERVCASLGPHVRCTIVVPRRDDALER